MHNKIYMVTWAFVQVVHVVFCQVPIRTDLCARFQTLDINTPQNPTCCCLNKSMATSTNASMASHPQFSEDRQKQQ